MSTAARAIAGAGLVVFVCATGLRATPLTVNTWSPVADMTDARTGASAVLLYSGYVLVTGGSNATGVLASVERYSPSGHRFLGTPPMSTPRAAHTSTLLPDGRVLVAGGVGVDGRALASTELYDPATNSWIQGPPLSHARATHTATALWDGSVLLAGGDDAGESIDSLELFEPNLDGCIALNAVLTSRRTGHASTLLYDGRVFVAGGSDGGRALDSTDLYDPYTGTIAAGPRLAQARAGVSANTLLDGQVAIVGGADDRGELATAEIYDPESNSIAAAGGSLSEARQRHLAILLPHNNALLIVGGTRGGVAVKPVDVFLPWQGAHGTFVSTAAPSKGRVWAVAAELSFRAGLTVRTGPTDGQILLAGGSALSDASQPMKSAEVYSFATVTTDRADYSPGVPVAIAGSGWLPGETVTLTFSEDPRLEAPALLTAMADINGNITSNQFVPDNQDANVTFTLTATGIQSQARTSFTDSPTSTLTTVVCSPTTVVLGSDTTCTATVIDNGNPRSSPQGSVGFTLTGGAGTFIPSVCTLVPALSDTSTCGVTFTPSSGADAILHGDFASDNVAVWQASASGDVTLEIAAIDGAGTIAVSPATATAGSTPAGFTFVFTSVGSLTDGSQFTIAVPSGWTAPQSTDNRAAGYVRVSAGSCNPRTIGAITGIGPWTVPVDIACTDGETVTLQYSAVTVPATVGLSTFTGQTKYGSGGRLTPIASSPAITVTPAAPARLAFTTQPSSNTLPATTFATQPVVAVQDQYGNTVTSSTAAVTLAIGTNPGAGTLSGTRTVNAVAGVSTFSGLSIDRTGSGYTLAATSAALIGATSGAFDIKDNQTISFGTLGSKTYGDADFGVSATASSGLAVAFTSQTASVCTVAGSTVHLIATGPCTVRASQAGDGNYNAASDVDQSFTVAKGNQTIAFGALGGKTYGDADFSVSATATSGLTVAFASQTPSTCTASASTVHLIAPGSCTIRASQAGDDYYSAAADVDQTFTIAKTSQTITFAALGGRTYGDASFDVSATASSGLPVTFTSRMPSVCTVDAAAVHLIAAGTCTIRASQAGGGNYGAAADVDQSFTAARATLTVKADDKTKAYGAAVPELTATYSGFVAGDTAAGLSGAPVLTTTATAASVLGTYPITVTAGTLTATSYVFAFVDGTLTTRKAGQMVTFGALGDKTYGDADFGISATASSGLAVSFASQTATVCTLIGASVHVIASGICTIRASQAGSEQYTAAGDVERSFTVAKATLIVSADDMTKTYGAALPELTTTFSGFVNGETMSALSGSPVATTRATAASVVGAYPISVTVGTLAASNYTFTFAPGTLVVNKAVLIVSVDDQTRAFGAPNPALTTSYSGFVNGDTTAVLSGSPGLSTTATANSAAGRYAISAAPGTLASENYSFTYALGTLTVVPGQPAGVASGQPPGAGGAFATERKHVLTVSAVHQTRQYGEANPTLAVVYSGFVDGDTESVLHGSPEVVTKATAGSPAGTYNITVTAGTLKADKYRFVFVSGTLTVTKATLTVAATPQTKEVGMATPPLTASYRGFVNDDSEDVLSGRPVLWTTAGKDSPAGGYVIAVTAGTLSAANYGFEFVDATLTVVEPIAE